MIPIGIGAPHGVGAGAVHLGVGTTAGIMAGDTLGVGDTLGAGLVLPVGAGQIIHATPEL